MLAPSYSKAILALYRHKLATQDPFMPIRQLSPGSIKTACLEACREREIDLKGTRALRGFFQTGSDRETFLTAIDEFPISKFKPVRNFLIGKTKNPDDMVVELVAWLVDFQPRPYDPGFDYTKIPQPSRTAEFPNKVATGEVATKKYRPGPIPPEPIQDDSQPIPPATDKKKTKPKRFIIAITISIALGMPAYIVCTRKPTQSPIEGQACMYWAGNFYQPINCNEKVENVPVIALDTSLFYHFKKITRPDTITINAAGHIWYARYRGNYEFFTAEGYHPLDPNLRLRPASVGIILHHTVSDP